MGVRVQVGPFELLTPLGAGGMGQVWRAVHTESGTQVALKVVGAGDGTAATILGEVQAIARLDHPHIVEVLDFGTVRTTEGSGALSPGAAWMAMELVAGGTLTQHAPQLDFEGVQIAVRDVLAALAHAHAHGLVHRDVKPANVLRTTRGRYKLADFGLAHALGAVDGRLAGTPAFMAPEQLDGRWRDYGPHTDLYAVGAMAWTLTTGLMLRGGPGTGRASGPSVPFRPRFGVPAGWEALVRTLLAPDRRDRPTRAADVVVALDDLGPVVEAPTSPLVPPDAGATFVLDEPSTWEVEGASIDPVVDVRARLPRAPLPDRTPFAVPRRRPVSAIGLALMALREPPLVGRTVERDALWALLRRVATSGAPSVVRVWGPLGSGRSRLVRWLATTAHETGTAEVLTLPVHRRDPAAAVLEATYRLAGLTPQEALTRLRREATADGMDAPALGVLLGVLRREPGASRLSALLCMITALASERVCIVVLDGGSADAWSRALFARVAALDAPVLGVVVGSVDDQALDDRPLPGAVDLEVGPLEAAEARRFAREALRLDRALSEALMDRVAGDLGLAVQLVRWWSAHRLLVPGPQGLTLRPGARFEVPSSLDASWTERVGAVLGAEVAEAWDILELLATLGSGRSQEVQSRALAAAELDASALPADALSRAGLVELTPAGVELPDALRVVLDQRAERGGRSVRWHRAAAEAARRCNEPQDVLAHHLLSAGALEEALRPALEGALAVRPLDQERAMLLLERRQAAVEALGIEDRRAFDGLHWLAWFSCITSRPEEAKAASERVLAAAVRAGWSDLEASACHTLALLAQSAGEPEEAIAYGARAYERYRATGAHGFACGVAMDVLRQSPDFEGETELIDELCASSDPNRVALGLRHRSMYLLRTGALEGARHAAEESLALYERAGAHAQVRMLLSDLSDACRYLGDLDAAEDAILRLRATVDPHARQAVTADVNLGLILTLRGRYAEARGALETCLVRVRKMGWPALEGPVLVSLVPALIATDTPAAAGAALQRGLELLGGHLPAAELDTAEMLELAMRMWHDRGDDARAGIAGAASAAAWRRLQRPDRAGAVEALLRQAHP